MRQQPSNTFRGRLATALLLGFLAQAVGASEKWYVVSIAGQPVGSIEERRTEEGGEVRTGSAMNLVLNRLGSKVEMSTEARYRELPDGSLRGVDMDLKLSTQVTSTSAAVEDGQVRIRSGAGEQAFERTAPFTGALLGPDGIAKLSADRLKAPGDVLEVQTFSAELGGVVQVKRTALARETLDGVSVLKLEEEVSGYPVKRALWIDAAGGLAASEEAGPFGVMRVARADAAAARRAAEGGELPEEVYGGTMVRTQVRIPTPRRSDWVQLRLLHRNPDLGWPDLNLANQRVVEKTDKSLVLEITRPQPAAGLPFPVAPTDANRELLEANAYIQSSDPAIRAQALEIVGGERDLMKAALKLERWVAENMNFDLGIVMAPATEIFRDRRATCAGYATLLATLVRAAGIPSRYMLGYVYVDGMFGGHAWVEVLAGDQWVPLDAAIVGAEGADAARFAFQSTSLREGVGALNSGGALQMFGQIDLQVLGYRHRGGEKVAVPPDAKLYTLEGDRYRNTGLGIELVKPAGFQFTSLDAIWPEKALVGMTGPAGEKVVLESSRFYPWDGGAVIWNALGPTVPGGQRDRMVTAGHPALVLTSEGKAALALERNGELWLLRAEGQDAAALLRTVAATLRFP